MRISKKIKLFLISVLLFLLSGSVIFANNEWSLETDWPEPVGPAAEPLTTDSGIADLVVYFYEWGVVIGVLAFFGVLVFAGFRYLTSTGNPERLKKARKMIVSGFSGVLLLLGSYLLLNTINPELTNIQRITPAIVDIGTHQFSPGIGEDINLCEFAFVTVQEDETGGQEETFFMIPGMSTDDFDEVFPVRSMACTPERNIAEIREVRESDSEEAWVLVEKQSGEILDSVEYDSGDSPEELYERRYHDSQEVYTVDSDQLFDFLSKAQINNNYNVFNPDECEDIVRNPKFGRPRCLELDRSTRQITEWVKVGYPSLTDAYSYIENNDVETCPGIEELDDPFGSGLGYKNDSSGGGCSIAFYDGTETEGFWVFSSEVANCREQISRPSATMDHFDGIVDRETNCMELVRHEPPLDLDQEEFRHLIQIDIDGTTGVTGKVRVVSDTGAATKTLGDGQSDLFSEGDYTLHWEHDIPQIMGAGGLYDAQWNSPACGTDTAISKYDSSECPITLDDDLTVEITITAN